MGIDEQLDREIEQIENDDSLTQAERNKAIREAELGAGDAQQQYLDEREALDRRYGR
jgi:hypothetical protein